MDPIIHGNLRVLMPPPQETRRALLEGLSTIIVPEQSPNKALFLIRGVALGEVPLNSLDSTKLREVNLAVQKWFGVTLLKLL